MEDGEKFFRKLISDLGDDPYREGLRQTPKRVLNTFQELMSGYKEDLDSLVMPSLIPVEDTYRETQSSLVVLRDIEFYSLCEHHLLPFFGVCHVAFEPRDSLLGLSKIKSIVSHFSRRLQVQERLTSDIAQALQQYLNPKGVAVTMVAQHFCLMMRGTEKSKASLTTFSTYGDDALINDFISKFY